jgi:hypothetical protein
MHVPLATKGSVIVSQRQFGIALRRDYSPAFLRLALDRFLLVQKEKSASVWVPYGEPTRRTSNDDLYSVLRTAAY